MPSSISSSERSMPGGSFPWAVFLAFCTIVLLELGLHLVPEKSLLNYGRGLGTYYEVDHTIDAFGAADISVVGSSRGRESMVMPLLSNIINRNETSKVTVANYSCPGSTANDIELVVSHLLGSSHLPKLIIYFLSPRVLLGNFHSMQKAEVFGVFPDSYGHKPGAWLASLTERPIWEFRNILDRQFLLFRHRYHFRYLVSSTIRHREPTQPIQGEKTIWQRYTPNRSLVTNPVPDKRIKNYINRLLDEDGNYILSETRIHALRLTLEKSRSANVRTILVETPISPDLEKYYPEGVIGHFHEIMADIQKEYKVPFMTIPGLGIEFTRENFREQSHLNFSGAEKLTKAVAEKLVLPSLELQDK